MRMPVRKSIILSLPLLIGALIALGALSGCGPERVNSTAPTVSYNVTGSSMTQANARASSYCDKYGEPSRLLSVQNGVATYSCGASTAAVPPATTPPTYSAPAYRQSPTYTAPPAPAYPRTSPISPTPAQ